MAQQTQMPNSLVTPVSFEGSVAPATRLKALIRDIFLFEPNPDENPNAVDPNIHKSHELTHFPKDPRCPICTECKTRKANCRRRLRDDCEHV